MLYQKKPLVVNAIQLRWDTWGDVCDLAGVGKLADGKPTGTYINPDTGQPTSDSTDEIGLCIPTLEGVMIARQGDWIIKGVGGEIYPCKSDIFAMTYEEVAMPKVGKRHFPYTPAGYKAASKARKASKGSKRK